MDKATFDNAMAELQAVVDTVQIKSTYSFRYIQALKDPEILSTPPQYLIDAQADVERISEKYLPK